MSNVEGLNDPVGKKRREGLTKRGDAAIVVAGVENDKVQQISHLKGPPDSQIVIHVDLSVRLVRKQVIFNYNVDTDRIGIHSK